MRDKNLHPQQFYIQFEKKLKRVLTQSERFLRTAVSDSPTTLDSTVISISYPRTFREIRALAVAQWFFPENLHWRILLDLQEKNFNQFNLHQRLELSLYLDSKEIALKYLYETKRYSSYEIFGNFLGNDLNQALKSLRITEKRSRKPVRNTRVRGYRDKGGRKPAHKWLPSNDFLLTEHQNEVERRNYLLFKTSIRLKEILREFLQQETLKTD